MIWGHNLFILTYGICLLVVTGNLEAANKKPLPVHTPHPHYRMTQCLGQVEALIHQQKSLDAQKYNGITQWLINFFLNYPGLEVVPEQYKARCSKPDLNTSIGLTEFLLAKMGEGLADTSTSGKQQLKSPSVYFLELMELWDQYLIFMSEGLTPTCFSTLFKEFDLWLALISYGQNDPQFYDSAKKVFPALIQKMSEYRTQNKFEQYCAPNKKGAKRSTSSRHQHQY